MFMGMYICHLYSFVESETFLTSSYIIKVVFNNAHMAFVKPKVLALIIFSGVVLSLPSKASAASLDSIRYPQIPANAHVECNQGYTEIEGECIVAAIVEETNVKGAATSRFTGVNTFSTVVFLLVSAVGTWYLMLKRSPRTLW
jgi:hypothetical protein